MSPPSQASRPGRTSVPTPLWVDAVSWTVVAAMVVAGLAAWSRTPEALPVHWNAAGQVDRYGPRWEALLLLPAIAAVVVLALRYLPEIDPRRARYQEFAGAFTAVRLLVVGALAAMYLVTLLASMGVQMDVGWVIPVLVGAMLAGLGSLLDRVRPNWFIGIRTPWTLSSERSWTLTHRAGRWVFVAMGAAFIAAGLVHTPWAIGAASAICAAGVFGLVIYSYLTWRRDPAST